MNDAPEETGRPSGEVPDQLEHAREAIDHATRQLDKGDDDAAFFEVLAARRALNRIVTLARREDRRRPMTWVERGGTTELRAWETFRDLSGNHHSTGALTWEPEAVEGYAFDAWDNLANIDIGDEFGGASLGVGADCFGTLVRRLVQDGAEVRPRQPVAEVRYRNPTFTEYKELWDRWSDADNRLSELERQTPLEAFRRARRARRT
jgi:hypothetical protein